MVDQLQMYNCYTAHTSMKNPRVDRFYVPKYLRINMNLQWIGSRIVSKVRTFLLSTHTDGCVNLQTLGHPSFN